MSSRRNRRNRIGQAAGTLATLLAAGSLAVAAASPAGACGGLVGPNGSIELVRTTTLAAYHDGVERYVTSFEFTGEGEELGSIIPLPDIPTSVERGGDWTLQRLSREVAPPEREADGPEAVAADTGGAEVILETEIDALDITILKGGGSEVGEWAVDNGFFLTPDAPEVLDFYADRSPIFMAAKFDASRAAELQQTAGQGTPIMLTIPTDAPWVPLRILGLGLDADQNVQADVFVLTDDKPNLLAGGRGLTLDRSEAASDLLLADLRSDVGMEWVPDEMWFSYLKVDAPAGELTFDLAATADQETMPSVEAAGIAEPDARIITPADSGPAVWPISVGLATGAAALLTVVLVDRRRRQQGPQAGAAA